MTGPPQIRQTPYSLMKDLKVWGAACLLVGLVAFMSFQEKVTVDPDTFCPLSAEPIPTTAILIDTSDPMTAAQRLATRQFIQTLDQTSPLRPEPFVTKGTKIVGYLLTNEDRPKPFLEICHPGSDEHRNKITESERIFKMRLARFGNTIDAALEESLEYQAELNQSPILESLAYIRSSKDFPSPDLITDQNILHNIIIVSNLIQNSELTSHLHGLDNPTAIIRTLPISLRGIGVRVLFVADEGYQHLQTAKLKTWWRRYFAATGASLTWSTL